VLILVFLSISLNKTKDDFTESYKVEGFVQGVLQYTTTCATSYELNDIRKLIFKCAEGSTCLDGVTACNTLNETLSNLLNLSWSVGQEWPTNGYFLNITSNGEELLSIFEGNVTQDNKGTMQSFSQGSNGQKVDIIFVVYSKSLNK
jgi:hypothetical protein